MTANGRHWKSFAPASMDCIKELIQHQQTKDSLMSLDLQFDHIGIPVDSPQAEEFWVPESECWVTNPRTHPQRIEYLRFKSQPELEPGSPQWKLWNMPHIAYRVHDLERAIEGAEVVYGPFEPADFGQVVFIHQHEIIVEYLQYTDLSTWFGAPTPWTPA